MNPARVGGAPRWRSSVAYPAGFDVHAAETADDAAHAAPQPSDPEQRARVLRLAPAGEGSAEDDLGRRVGRVAGLLRDDDLVVGRVELREGLAQVLAGTPDGE